MKFGNANIDKVYFGSSQISKAYFGASEIYSQSTPSLPYTTDGLLVYYDAHDGSGSQTTWLDKSSNGNNGVLYNFTFDSNNGWTQEGLKLDGIGTYVLTTNPITAYCLEIYAKVTTPSAVGNLYNCYISTITTSAVTSNLCIYDRYYTTDLTKCGLTGNYFTSNGSLTNIYSAVIPQAGMYYHMLIQYTGTAVQIYINGELKSSVTIATSTFISSQMVLGKVHTDTSTTSITDGMIVMARAYSRALIQDEITLNYNQAIGS